MSQHERCSFCRDLFDILEFPQLQTKSFKRCEDCWHKVQDYLTESGFGITGMRTNPCPRNSGS